MVRIDTTSSVPVFQQIMDELKSAIARGVYGPDDMIPSVRQLAAQALVNPNTVARSYRELEHEGVIYTRKGVGVFVALGAPLLCRQLRRTQILAALTRLAAEARRAGVSDAELLGALQEAMAQGEPGPESPPPCPTPPDDVGVEAGPAPLVPELENTDEYGGERG